MRFLLINNHCISDATAGVTQSLRTIMRWLMEAGHDCQILTTSRFESPVTFTIDEHLRGLGVSIGRTPLTRGGARRRGEHMGVGPQVARYAVDGVPVTMLRTRHNDESRPDPREGRLYLDLLDDLIQSFAPDQLIACNGHPMVQEGLRRARRRGITTSFAVRGHGYYEPHWYTDVDHVFTCSQFLTDHYRERIGLTSTPLEPPLEWEKILAPTESRAFVTFVHPAPHKGLLLFARLADMLGSQRPDIPLLVIQSGQSGGSLNTIPELDFSRYPQIMAAPAVPTPADYLALTRILLVPSVWDEPFGRVAAEAMINGIPPIVSDRGSLPGVVGGDWSGGGAGRVIPPPGWMTITTTQLPSESEVRPWFDAVCELWDDPSLYRRMAARGRAVAEERYAEEISRARHVGYFTALRSGGPPPLGITASV